MVFTPCPISGFLLMIVTMPSGVMRMNALRDASDGAKGRRALAAVSGSR
jgi:hypothetical protein